MRLIHKIYILNVYTISKYLPTSFLATNGKNGTEPNFTMS